MLNYAASHLFINTKNGFEPQRTNNFYMSISGLSNLRPAGGGDYSPKIRAMLNNMSDDITLSIKNGFTPKENISVLTVPYGNSEVKFAGRPTYDEGTIIWNDYYDKDIELILKAWQKAAYNAEKGFVGDASNYKLTAIMTMCSPGYTVERSWRIHGCWLANVNGDDMGNEGNSIRTLSAQFVYDWAERLEDANEIVSHSIASEGNIIIS